MGNLATIEEKLIGLGLSLPVPRKPKYNYLPVIRHGDLIFVSGQLPWVDAQRVMEGRLGEDLDVEMGKKAARLCVLEGLSVVKEFLGGLGSIHKVLKVSGFVRSADGFVEQPGVIDAASDLIVDLLGENGKHSRSAIGVAELPRGAAVEIEFLYTTGSG